MSNVFDFIQTKEFATLPTVVIKILELLKSDDVDIRAVIELIEADAPLTIKLLRVANSPLFALRSEVNSIHQAIIHIGVNRIINIVIGVSIFSKFFFSQNKSVNNLLEGFWWHSSCVAMISKSITLKTGIYYKELEFLGGLLHDIGKLALIQYNVEDYLEVIRLVVEDGYNDMEAEQKIFKTDHTIIGTEIAKLWKLPIEVIDVISNHERLDDFTRNKEFVASVRIADLLAELWGASFHEGLRTLKLEEDTSWILLSDTYSEFKNIDVELFTFELEADFRKTVDFLKLIKS